MASTTASVEIVFTFVESSAKNIKRSFSSSCKPSATMLSLDLDSGSIAVSSKRATKILLKGGGARKSFSKKYTRVGYRQNLHSKLVVVLIARLICQNGHTQIQINRTGSFEKTSQSSETSGRPPNN